MTDIAFGNTLALLAPVVLDLDGDGVEFISFVTSTVVFDMDGDGDPDRTSWVATDDAILVYDRNGNGLADNGTEIGFQSLVPGAASDLEGLAFFDANADAVLDATDAEYGKFFVWQDVDQDGVSDPGEMQTLSEAGIMALDLEGVRTGRLPDGRDTVVFATSAYLKSDSSTGEVADAFFVFEPSNTVPDAGGGGSGGGTVPDPEVAPPPTLALSAQGFERKAKKYLVEARDGSLFVTMKKGGGVIDARANSIGPAIILNFKNKSMGMLSPVILDLDGDGLDLKSAKKSRAMFDMDGDGVGDDTGWVGKGDGILVIDRNGDGLISAASELSFLTEDSQATSDLDALAKLDSNRDNKISSADGRFGELKVWVDANQNGESEGGELKTLTELGITEIALSSRANNSQAKPGQNVVVATSTFTRSNGTTGTIGDVALAFSPSSALSKFAAPTSGENLDAPTDGGDLSETQLANVRAALASPGFEAKTQSSLAGLANIDSSAGDPRLALMVQSMASFGAQQGEAGLKIADRAQHGGLDWFGVSAI